MGPLFHVVRLVATARFRVELEPEQTLEFGPVANNTLISLVKQDDDTDQDISDGKSQGASEDTSECTLSSDIEEDNLDHQQEVQHLCQACLDKKLRKRRVPMPK